MALKSDAKIGEESKLTWGIWLNLRPKHSKVSKMFNFMGSIWTKYVLFDLKKYWGFIFRDNEECCKIWRKTDLWFGKWQKKFDKFWPEHSKVLKSLTLLGSVWAKYILFQLKHYRGIIFHDTEEWSKIWRGTVLLFQISHEEFDKF